MTCYCSGGDPPEWYTERIVAARKDHRCCECTDVIKIGERHQYVAGKWNGDVGQYRTCLSCAELRAETASEFNDYSTPAFGSLGCCYMQDLIEDARAKGWKG